MTRSETKPRQSNRHLGTNDDELPPPKKIKEHGFIVSLLN